MTAFLLEKSASRQCDVAIFEASDRLGGKVITWQFDKALIM